MKPHKSFWTILTSSSILLTSSFGGCQPEKIEFSDHNTPFTYGCQGSTRVHQSSFYGEVSSPNPDVSWYIFRGGEEGNLKSLKFLYNSGELNQNSIVVLSPNGVAGDYFVEEKLNIGNGRAIYKIDQRRETYNGVYNVNATSTDHENGDFRITVEECIDTYNIGDELKIEIINR